MEKFLGILFCGGRGTRLGEISQYISKSFVPIYNRPVFRYGLSLLEQCKYVDEIVILSNDENNAKLKQTGYKTIVQDDNLVYDMFSGWNYVKNILSVNKHGILMPSDNVCDVNLDTVINGFLQEKAKIAFSIYEVEDREKLKEMGCFDEQKSRFYYKHPNPPTPFGVIAPYAVHNKLPITAGDQVLDNPHAFIHKHRGFWFDIGNINSILETSQYLKNMQT